MTLRPATPEDKISHDPKKDPNAQPGLLGGVNVPFQLTPRLRWVHRDGRYILQQMWQRAVTPGTLALRPKTGPAVGECWIDVPRGEE